MNSIEYGIKEYKKQKNLELSKAINEKDPVNRKIKLEILLESLGEDPELYRDNTMGDLSDDIQTIIDRDCTCLRNIMNNSTNTTVLSTRGQLEMENARLRAENKALKEENDRLKSEKRREMELLEGSEDDGIRRIEREMLEGSDYDGIRGLFQFGQGSCWWE